MEAQAQQGPAVPVGAETGEPHPVTVSLGMQTLVGEAEALAHQFWAATVVATGDQG